MDVLELEAIFIWAKDCSIQMFEKFRIYSVFCRLVLCKQFASRLLAACQMVSTCGTVLKAGGESKMVASTKVNPFENLV